MPPQYIYETWKRTTGGLDNALRFMSSLGDFLLAPAKDYKMDEIKDEISTLKERVKEWKAFAIYEYSQGFGDGYGWGIATMCIIFLVGYGILSLLK